jgi:radical SAM superfamily enzyme YgiQ (UPF0313 family)
VTALEREASDTLRAPGSILLLSCYELGHAPLGLAWPQAFLQAAGFRPVVQDLAMQRLNAGRVERARFVGISVPMHTALRLGMEVARRVRALNPAAHICFYGLYAGLNAELLLAAPDGRAAQGAQPLADSVLGGEHEPALVALVEALEAGLPVELPGVSTRAGRSPARLARTAFPAPVRDRLRGLTGYAQLETPSGRRAAGYVEASRGCKHLCLHCPIPPAYGGRFFTVPREVVLQDVAALAAQGAEHITFGDPDFFNGPGHAARLVEALHERFPALTYDATIKVEHLLRQRALLPVLARTGCLFIVTAAESLSDTVLGHLHKGHSRADFEAALAAVLAAGIALRPTWVPFTPWSTLEDYRELLDFLWREGLVHHVDPVQLAIRLLVPSGSALLGTPQFAPFQGPLDAAALSHTWRHPDPRMDALQRRVAVLVEEAAGDPAPDAEATFRAVHAAAQEAAGHPPDPSQLPSGVAHPLAPRLTEPWFC